MYVDRNVDTLSRKKSAWEAALRLRLGLPRFSTANDGAVALVRAALLVAAAAALVGVCCPWAAGVAAAGAASAFAGLALQQYAWYTARIFSECWPDEGFAVASIIGFASLLLGGLTLLLWAALSGLRRALVLGALHAGLLAAYRWGFWGSLFDGVEKLQQQRRR